MANKKITELDSAGALDGTEAFALVKGGATKRSVISAIATWLRPIFVPILALLFGWVSVKDYGATGDGTTDDYAAIAAAYAAAGANGVVYLPPGTYRLSAAVTPLAGQTIRGAGMRATTLQFPTATTINGLNLSAANVTIMDLGIDGNRAAQTVDLGQTTNAGAYVTAANATFRRVWIRGTRGMGISATNAATGLTVEDSYLDGGHTDPTVRGTVALSGTANQGVSKGIYCSGTDNVKIRRNTITGWSQGVGLWFGNSDCFVTDNDIINNYGFEDAGHTVFRSACEDYGAGTGANLRNTWARNLIDGSTSRCLEIAQGVTGSRYLDNILKNPGLISGNGSCWEITGQTGQLTTDILIRGNWCQGGTDHSDANTINGLASRITIEGNTFADYTHASVTGAIFVGGLTGGTDIVIAKNTFVNCRGAVRLNATNDGHEIVNNIMSAMISAGFGAIGLLSGSGHLVSGNKIAVLGGYAIQATAGARHIITGNLASSANSSAINTTTNDCTITDNDLVGADAGSAGVLGIAGSRNLVYRNRINSTTTRRGIAVTGSADYNIVQDNIAASGFLSGSDVVYTTTSGTHNTLEPNHTATVTKALTLKALGAQTVGTSEQAVAHGLGYAPTVVEITPTSDGRIWKGPTAITSTNIYLQADAAARTAEIFVR